MLVYFHLTYNNCHSVMQLKRFQYHTTNLEALILMSKGGNPNVCFGIGISPKSEFLSLISFDKTLH